MTGETKLCMGIEAEYIAHEGMSECKVIEACEATESVREGRTQARKECNTRK